MPRAGRAVEGGICYHVLNRSNDQRAVFRRESDYQEFLSLMEKATERVSMRVLAFALMPNHFHLVLWPHEDRDMGKWMQWLMTSHVRRHHGRYQSMGHLWQGRYKSFPIQNDKHLLTVLRYVERNPLRAKLVTSGNDWPWSSLRWWHEPGKPAFLHPTQTVQHPEWVKHVNQPQTETELEAMRTCIRRGRPYGAERWVRKTAEQLGLEATLRPPGRPKGTKKAT